MKVFYSISVFRFFSCSIIWQPFVLLKSTISFKIYISIKMYHRAMIVFMLIYSCGLKSSDICATRHRSFLRNALSSRNFYWLNNSRCITIGNYWNKDFLEVMIQRECSQIFSGTEWLHKLFRAFFFPRFYLLMIDNPRSEVGGWVEQNIHSKKHNRSGSVTSASLSSLPLKHLIFNLCSRWSISVLNEMGL